MLAHAWYTVNYFKVSFGKQDQLQQSISRIISIEELTIDTGRNVIFQKLAASSNKATLKELRYFNAEVPHRFLSPWFPAANMQQAYEESRNPENNSPYALFGTI